MSLLLLFNQPTTPTPTTLSWVATSDGVWEQAIPWVCTAPGVWEQATEVYVVEDAGVSYIGAGVAYAGLGATSIDVPLPAGSIDGDLLLLSITVRGAVTITPPAGWTLVGGGAVSFLKFNVFSKIRDAGDVDPVTFTTSAISSQTTVAQCLAFRGAAGVNAGTAHAVSGSTTVIGPVAGLSAAANSIVVVIGAATNDWTSISSLSGDGLTWSQVDASTAAGGDAGQVIAWAPVDSPTTVTAKSWTIAPDPTGIQGGQMFEVYA